MIPCLPFGRAEKYFSGLLMLVAGGISLSSRQEDSFNLISCVLKLAGLSYYKTLFLLLCQTNMAAPLELCSLSYEYMARCSKNMLSHCTLVLVWIDMQSATVKLISFETGI